MNHTYKTLYNDSLGLWRAVPETAKAHGKSKNLKVGAGATAVRGVTCVVAALALLGAVPPALAVDLYWDGADTTSGNGVPTGGSGIWDAATANWTNDAAGTTNQAWVAGDNAIFGNTGGTVTLSGSQSVGDISFAVTGYTIQGGTGLNLANTSTLTVSNGEATISSTISGSGGISKQGAGTLSLTGTNTYSGYSSIDGGTLAINNGSALGSGGIQLAGGELLATEDLTLSPSSFLSNSTLSVASGKTLTLNPGTALFIGGSPFQIGSAGNTGTVVFAPDNRFMSCLSCQISVNYGTLKAGNSQLGQITSGSFTTTIASGAELDFNDFNAWVRNLQGAGTLNTGSAATTDLTLYAGNFSGTIQGAGALIKSTTGTLTLSGANTYTGGTTITGGTLALAGGAAIADTGAVVVNGGGTLSLAASETIGSLAGAGSVSLNANTLTTGGNNASTTYSGVMSGSGGLTKTGTGTFTLTGANTYSGGTTVSAGTLQGDSSSLQGAITNNAAVTFDQVADGTYSGIMSGTGSLTKSGAGVLTLNGTNTYSGGTTVSAGTLQGDTSSLQGAITNNAAVTFDQVADGTYSGVMSGTGSLTKSGTGILTLTGNNTYAGGTTVSAGTLQGDSTSLQGNIVNNASLAFNQSANGTYADVISGTGSLTKSGTGILTLTGNNTYSGGTTVSAGTLQGDTRSLQGNIANNAAVSFNQGTDGTYADVISGTGSLTKSGTGILTLTGTNTYSGGTTVSAGTLQGDTASLQGNIANNAAVSFNQGTDGTYSGNMSGTGSLTKSGTGILILNGANTYTGTTTINGGTLEVGNATHPTASLASAVTVNSGGTLRGHGTINGNVSNGGTVAPGGSIGVLSINGNYTQSAAGTLTIGVMPTATTTAIAGTDNDQLNVSGTASLAGILAVNVNSGTYTVGTQYNIVHAGTAVSGTFNSVAYNPAFASYVTPQLSYGANDVFLTLNPTAAAFTSGQSTSISDWSSMQALMSSEQTVLNVQGGTAGAILKVNGRPDPAVWVRSTIGSGGAYGANLDNNSLLVGGGDEIRPGLIIGAALGSTSTRTSTTQDQVKTRSTGLYLYTLYNNGPLFVDATATAGNMNTNSVRSLTTTALIATGSASGSYAGVSGRAGYRITKGNAFVTPYVGAGYLHTRRNAYTETGAGILNLSYAAMNYDIGTLSAGARVGTDVEQASGMVVSPWVELGGIVYTGNRNQGQTVTLGSVQQVLPATGAPASAATLNAGLALMSQGNWSAQFVYHGEYSQNSHMNTADVKAVYRW